MKQSPFTCNVTLAPVLRDPSTSVQDSVLFSYDDVFGLPVSAAGAKLRALREGNWTYAVYFGRDGSGLEYELYDLVTDPLQLKNMLHGSPNAEIRMGALAQCVDAEARRRRGSSDELSLADGAGPPGAPRQAVSCAWAAVKRGPERGRGDRLQPASCRLA